MYKTKSKKGITLVSLVITIIVLMILAGVAISIATGQDSIFSKANEAASKWNESVDKEMDALGELINELNSRSMVEVTDNIVIANEPTGWTSGNVKVTLSYENIPSGYEIQYKVGEGEWTTGTSITVEENNTTVHVRLYNPIVEHETAVNSVEITNIDRIEPTAPTNISSSQTINSVTVTASGGTDAGSGVVGYKYSINGTDWTDTIPSGTSHTFSRIKANTEVTIYAKTIDNVGEESNQYTTKVRTSQIGSNVAISPSPSGWTSGDVTVTISHSSIPAGYEIQYKIGNGNWTTGTSATVTANNTTVTGRLYNTTLQDEIAVNSIVIGTIDKTAPTAPTGITSSVTTNSIIVTASGGTDSQSGIAGYQYSRDNKTWTGTIASGTSNTFTGLAGATNYTIYARTVDKVGNVSTNYSKSIRTSDVKVASISLSNVTISASSTVATIPKTISPSNATNQTLTWSSSNPAVATVNANGVVTYVGPGTAVITAIANDGSGVQGRCSVICAETTSYWGRLYNGECAEYGSTKYKTWNIELTSVSTIQFDLWAGGNAYYGWAVWARLKINGQEIYATGQNSAGSNSGQLIGTANWDVRNYSGNAVIEMSVYGRSVKGDPNPYYMWGEIRNMTLY